MDSVLDALYADAVCHRYYRETAVEARLYRRTERLARHDKRLHGDLMRVLAQYERQGFALGLRYALALSSELSAEQTL